MIEKIKNLFLKDKISPKVIIDINERRVRGIVYREIRKKNILMSFVEKEIKRFDVLESRDFEFDIHKKAIEGVLTSLKDYINSDTKLWVAFPYGIIYPELFKISLKDLALEKDSLNPREINEKIFQDVFQKASSQGRVLKVLITDKKIKGYSMDGVALKEIPFQEGIVFEAMALLLKNERKEMFEKTYKFLSEFVNKKNIEIIHRAEIVPFVFENGFFIDIAPEATFVGFSRGGIIKIVRTLEIGYNRWVESLEKFFHQPWDFVEQMFYQYSLGKLSGGVSERLEQGLKERVKIWFQNLQERLEGQKEEIFFERVYLLGASENPLVKKNLKTLFRKESLTPVKLKSLRIKNKTSKRSFNAYELSSLVLMAKQTEEIEPSHMRKFYNNL